MEEKLLELTQVVYTLIRDELFAQVTNMGTSIFVRFPDGNLFDITCKFVHNLNDKEKRKSK
ncbi:MAG: hypothetical protein NC218_12715 [Acetobacter sp.]|nr:hypothetical protein [Acetobacter sp.]